MSYRRRLAILAIGLAAATSVDSRASHERFHKDSPNSMGGLMAAKDPTYVKECGSCHFAYSPGLLPARSWEMHVQRLEKHFGESVVLPAATREAVRKYLVDNAADRSPFEGSKYLMTRVSAESTPYRFEDVRMFREVHRVIREVISMKSSIKVRTLTNCNECHHFASEGSYATDEMVIPGLTPNVRAAQ